MHALIPNPGLYPAEPFRRALNRALPEGGPELLLYGSPQGDLSLRRVLAERLGRAGIRVTPAEVVLCHGASQGISLALRVFAGAGDVVAFEEPTYNNVLAAALGLGIEAAAVPMRADGMDLAVLERTLARPEVKALYTIPTFHNPMGTTTQLAHRRAVLDAARAGVPIIEDGYEMDLRFTGRSLPALAGLDDSGLVVHLFSFSKSLFPGARVGAITARGRTVEALLALKQASDLSDALPIQVALAAFVASGEYDRHLTRLRRVLRDRRDALLDALARRCPRAPAGPRRRAATRCGWSCRRRSTHATCSPTPSAPARCSRPDPSSTTTTALRAACASRSRWPTPRTCASGSPRSAACRGAAGRHAAPNGGRTHLRSARRSPRRRTRRDPDGRKNQSEHHRKQRRRPQPHHRRVLRAQGRPRRDAQGRRDHGRDQRRAGQDRRGCRRRGGDGAGARPADIRKEGGVARMAAIEMIERSCSVVSIPVMAKARIGHFVEARVLEALGVDFIDESEVLTPADEEHHIDKNDFKVPFVCGARNLGEALRRIGEGAAMIRTKGEAGSGNIVEAVRHMRTIVRRDEQLTVLRQGRSWRPRARSWRRRSSWCAWVAEHGRLPVPNFSAGGIATPADAALVHAAGRGGGVRRLGDLQDRGSGRAARTRSCAPPRTGTTPQKCWRRAAGCPARCRASR